ncbi:MAG TPA: 6-carboxytetrahydropterin synthase QueD [Acidobacteriota bacterium]|nr:6-carboxytetrahydropterin synthase QueD [Acidobacteriota bacterium]HQM63648.1 6-carboxytetrahydropterin synthase QueD [Acidobacteriota bacterium]
MALWELTIKTDFSAAHQLRQYRGKCERLHGHNWEVEITVRCRELDAAGIGMDFTELRAATDRVLEQLDHSLLNELPAFVTDNPSAENVARHIHRELGRLVNTDHCQVWRVTVFESRGCSAAYLEASDG